MKAILVIDLPKSCYKCPLMFDDGNGIWCGVERDKDGDMYMRVHYYCGENERPSWCPLKPIHALKSAGKDYIIYERQYLYENLEREYELMKEVREFDESNISN